MLKGISQTTFALRQRLIEHCYEGRVCGGYWKVWLKRGFLRVLEEDLKAKP